jgi:hypothetical protein
VRSDGATAEEIAIWRNLAAGVFALFAAGAGIVQSASGPLWLKLVFAVIALVGAVVGLILLLKERAARAKQAAKDRRLAERVQSAVGLDLMRDGDETSLVVMNRGAACCPGRRGLGAGAQRWPRPAPHVCGRHQPRRPT